MPKKIKWQTVKVKVKDLKPMEINPRKISAKKEHQLQESIEEFDLAEIPVMNTDRTLIAGHQRHRILMQSGREAEEIEVRKPNRKLTEEEVKKYNIISNAVTGEFDFDAVELHFNEEQFLSFIEGYKPSEPEVKPEIEFSEYLGEANNYVVLFFRNEIDWINAQTHFSLKSVHSMRANGKPWSKGVGRVIDGAEYISKLNEDN